jgi:tetratricopeptide (TPR) repeat protein
LIAVITEDQLDHSHPGLDNLPGLIQSAKLAFEKGNFVAGARTYRAIADTLRQLDRVQQAAEMDNNAAVALLQAGDYAGALILLEGVPETFLQAGDIHRQALALGNRGMAFDELGQVEQAAALYEQSPALLRQCGDFDHRLYVLQALSKVYFRQGKPLLAVTAMRAGVKMLPHPSPRQRFLGWLLNIPDHFLPRSES